MPNILFRYDPNQPRDPGGEDGGQWTSGGGAGGSKREPWQYTKADFEKAYPDAPAGSHEKAVLKALAEGKMVSPAAYHTYPAAMDLTSTPPPEPSYVITDRTPPGYGPTEPKDHKHVTARHQTKEEQDLRSSIGEAKTILKGTAHLENRTAIEKALARSEDKLAQIEGASAFDASRMPVDAGYPARKKTKFSDSEDSPMQDIITDIPTFSIDATDSDSEASNVTYTGKVFEAGSYPDKAFDLTEEELAEAAAAFSEVHNNIEHKPSPLDGKLGTLSSVVAKGAELFGTITVPRQLRDLIGASIKPSLEWDAKTKRIVGNALTLTPRIQGAETFAAFSAALEAQLQTEVPTLENTANGALSADDRSILDKFKAFFSSPEKPEPEVVPVTFSLDDVQAMIDKAIQPLAEVNAALKAEVATFAVDALAEELKGVPPSMHAHIRAMAESGGIVKFTAEDGTASEKSSMESAIELARELKDKSKIIFTEVVEGFVASAPAEAYLVDQGVKPEVAKEAASIVSQINGGN